MGRDNTLSLSIYQNPGHGALWWYLGKGDLRSFSNQDPRAMPGNFLLREDAAYWLALWHRVMPSLTSDFPWHGFWHSLDEHTAFLCVSFFPTLVELRSFNLHTFGVMVKYFPLSKPAPGIYQKEVSRKDAKLKLYSLTCFKISSWNFTGVNLSSKISRLIF